MKLLKRRTPPEGAHYRRNLDGSWGTIWLCSEGHGKPGEVAESPSTQCMGCAFGEGPEPSIYHRATLAEAWDFIIELEGFRGATSGVGFSMIGTPA